MNYILLVEDNPIDAKLLRRFLGSSPDWPCQITWIDDGQKALWYLQSLEKGGVDHPPTLVLLDLNLPRYDGLEVLEAFRNSRLASGMPVILLSSQSAEQTAAYAKSRNLDADAYLEKPIGLVEFERLAARICAIAKASFSGARTVAA